MHEDINFVNIMTIFIIETYSLYLEKHYPKWLLGHSCLMHEDFFVFVLFDCKEESNAPAISLLDYQLEKKKIKIKGPSPHFCYINFCSIYHQGNFT